MLFTFSSLIFSRPLHRPAIVLLSLVVLAGNSTAQTSNAPPSLRQALEAAWQLSPQTRADTSRRAELEARERAAGSWISGEPAAVLAHRSDRLNNNAGFRENEVELELPLWNPGVRQATQREIAAQRTGYSAQFSLAKLKLAGELRELVANAAVAQLELELALRRASDAQTLASDIERRTKAGESARVDALQAQAVLRQAQSAAATAQGQLSRLQAQWRAATGLPILPGADEQLAQAADGAATLPLPANHPSLLQAQSLVDFARTRLELLEADKRSPMALITGAARDRANFGAQGDTKLRLALRIPLGGDNRNAPRQAAARAELDAAQAELDAANRLLPAELVAASAELRAARLAQAAAKQRAALSSDVQALIAKSWRLGDSDLPTRLRADNEQFEATLSEARGTADVQRAIAKLNQALGLLP